MSHVSHPAFPVDTHIHRLAHRWGLSNGKNVQKTERDLKEIFPEDIWNRLHHKSYIGEEKIAKQEIASTRVLYKKVLLQGERLLFTKGLTQLTLCPGFAPSSGEIRRHLNHHHQMPQHAFRNPETHFLGFRLATTTSFFQLSEGS